MPRACSEKYETKIEKLLFDRDEFLDFFGPRNVGLKRRSEKPLDGDGNSMY